MKQDGNDHLLSLSGETVGMWFEVFHLNQPMKDNFRGFYCGGREHFCFLPAIPMCLAGRPMELALSCAVIPKLEDSTDSV